MGVDINVHDQWAVESQGRIQDRTREHLGTTDKAIFAYRRLLLQGDRAGREGRAPRCWRRRRREAARLRGPVTIDGIAPSDRAGDLRRRRRSQAPRARASGRPPRRRPCAEADGMTFVERVGLWTDEQKRGRGPRPAPGRGAAARGRAPRLSPTSTACCAARRWSPARRRRAAERRRHHHHAVAKDTSHRTVFPVWSAGGGFGIEELEGAADVLMLPDPSTFRVLPWAPQDRLDAVRRLLRRRPADAAPPRATSTARALARWPTAGYDFVAGLEVEFHLFKLRRPTRIDAARSPASRASRPRSRCSPRATST